MVEEARLESVYTPKGYRGFESRFLRNDVMLETSHRLVVIKKEKSRIKLACMRDSFLTASLRKEFLT